MGKPYEPPTAEKIPVPLQLMNTLIAKGWPEPLQVRALYGYVMREHVEAKHPGQVKEIQQAFLETMPPEAREAWLFGYRFRDTPAPQGGEGDGDGGSG
jgi:hypothetical protein